MPLMEIRIDDATWDAATEHRRLEWSATLRELADPRELTMRDDANRMTVQLSQQETRFCLFTEDSTEALAQVGIAHDRMASLIQEYVDTVRQIARADRAGGIAKLEALDMAKKVTHDKAGRLVKRLLADFAIDHPTARRFFTLILSLRVDTTKLIGVHGHRTIR